MKKGFTLIELLAVIVILAVIALIATPIILGIIQDSRESSAKESADLYVDGLDKQIALKNLLTEFNPNSCSISGENVTCDGVAIDYKVDGRKPTSGVVNYSNGIITGYSLCIMDYRVIKSGNDVTITKETCTSGPVFGGTFIAAGVNDTHKGIVYLDPTNLSNTCNEAIESQNVNENNTSTTIKSGCMKFYVYDDSGSTYKMILDHNTTGGVIWNSSGDNSGGALEVAARLTEDTAGWAGNPRLISAQEVAHIVEIDTTLGFDGTSSGEAFYLDGSGPTYNDWQVAVATQNNKSRYAWLYDNTYGCLSLGCNAEDNGLYPNADEQWVDDILSGYWTSSADITSSFYTRWGSGYAWGVSNYGDLRQGYIGYSDSSIPYGVRPVIELPKSELN